VQTAQLTRAPVRVVAAADPIVKRLAGDAVAAAPGSTFAAFAAKDGRAALVQLQHDPLRVDLFVEGFGFAGAVPLPAVSVNARGLAYIEHRRSKDGGAEAGSAAAGSAADSRGKIVDWDEAGKAIYEDGSHGDDGAHAAHAGASADAAAVVAAGDPDSLWSENFKEHADSKPFGPTSVGVDVSFPHAAAAFGVPEHASSHALHATDGSDANAAYREPYRLYNLDVFEYELDNPMALYGSIPMLLAHAPSGSTAGAFWNNPTETYVDVTKPAAAGAAGAGGGVATRWISESGVFDLFLLAGPAPKAAIFQFTQAVGTQGLPPLFALGYHQCRWNYKDEADVFGVDAKFEEHAFPYDVLWLDIEHTDGKRYFTWDSALFPRPAAMQERLAARGHKMVTIIDPHMKRDPNYAVHAEAQQKGLYVRQRDGTSEYEGWCWPGSSSYLDFTSPRTRDFWADQFALSKYAGSTPSLYTWNDMNEPSVFNGPEVSMHKDARSLEGVEHREWHNLYGFYQVMATHEGQLRRDAARNARSFVLSRAFFAGSQRYGAIWTGDNHAKWDHLKQAAPMLLTIGVAGLTFSGADVGGFFQNPTAELMVRWFQAGSWQPFFRSHAHIDTQRREPWLFGDDTLALLRGVVVSRYTYLPLWYTLFAAANASGVPTMRPMWLEFPTDAAGFAIDDQWMVGDALLVKPVTDAGASSVQVYLPAGGHVWYDAQTLERLADNGAGVKGELRSLEAPLAKIPVLQRGGSIVPRQMRPRRSSALMRDDPYTLVVALDAGKRAQGQLYLDDGGSLDFRRGGFRLRAFDYAPDGSAHVLRSSSAGGGKTFSPANTIERILVAGLNRRVPTSVECVDGEPGSEAAPRAATFSYDAATDVLTIRKPDLKVAYSWSVRISF
jgi:alpha 1,3-glucosidase